MANTRYLTTVVEEHIRELLSREHGAVFTKQNLPLSTGGRHEFDAVSSDHNIVVSIKSASGRTAGGKNPSGKIKDCIAELYFLSLVDAPHRLLILTSPEFYALFMRAMVGKIASGIGVRPLALPPDIQAEVDLVQRAASDEVFPVLSTEEATIARQTAAADGRA